MKSLSDITASGFASNASAFAGGSGALPQHNFTPAIALANETIGHGSDPAYNTFLGSLAGSYVSTGSAGTSEGARNVAIGFKAGSSNTSGWQNTFVGFISGQKNTAGVYNTALGAYSLVENITGNCNTAIGADALWLNTNGHNNTGIGSYALQQNTVGPNNSAVGKDALRENTTGGENSAFGASALANNISGWANMAFGRNAMRLNINGGNNVAIGHSALYSSVSGDENVALGGYALVTSNGGHHNIAIGFGAFEYLTNGFQNVGIGYSVGDGLTDGDNNTFIGNKAGFTSTTGNRNVLIGHDVNASAPGASDEINIGNVIKGNRSSLLTEIAGSLKFGDGTTQTTAATGSGVSDGDKGDITVASGGTVWTVDAGAISLGKMANVATGTVFYRKTGSTGAPEVQTLATLKTDLGLSGTNSGDQASGTTTVNFGAFPGASDASATITGQAAIAAGSRVRAWIEVTATADHTADEHWLETIDVVAGNVAAGTGFTIYAKNTGTLSEPVGEQWATQRGAGPGTGSNQPRPDMGGGKGTRLYGAFTVGWEWI